MGLSVWCEPVCAVCASTSEGLHAFNGKVPVRELVKIAKAANWLVTRDDFFCSRYCMDQSRKDVTP